MAMTRSGVINVCNRPATLLYRYADGELLGMRADVIVPEERREDEAALVNRVVAGGHVESYDTQRVCRDGTVVPVWLAIWPILDSTGTTVGAVTIAGPLGEPRAAPDPVAAPPATPTAPVPLVPSAPPAPSIPPVPPVDAYVEVRPPPDDLTQLGDAHLEAEYAKERVQVHEARDRYQARMGEEQEEERVQVQEAHDRFQVAMRDERAKERVQVSEAQDRYKVRMGEEHAQEQVQVKEAQDRFQVLMTAGHVQAKEDREHLEAQLQQGQRLEVLGQLAGGVAHDFNNLLAVILNYAAFVLEDLAERGPELEAASRDVGQIQRAAERAADLTHQLLAFARREVVQPRVLDLNHVVTEVEQLLRRSIGADVTLQTELAADLWPVLADTGQLEQVLVNLAINARDAMPIGGTLTIDTANVVVDTADTDTETLPRIGRHVRLRVSDTGSGMPAEIIEHAFEPFFTTKQSGTGLGLSTVYGIVAQADGSIKIESEPGHGTTFTILVPVTEETAGHLHEVMPYERTPAGETVLVVEDQEALREVTERIFTRSGYQVITAANGAEAVSLAALHDGDIHLLLTDVVMPNMLGKEVAEKIRELKPDVEVLFMSGYARPTLASQGRLDRDVYLIEKPFTAAAIIEKAGRILNGHYEGLHAYNPADTSPPEAPGIPTPRPEVAGTPT